MNQENVRIMVIDDEINMCKSLYRLLAGLGYDSVSYQNGEDALCALKKDFFDLVISDLNMPEINGIDLLSRIKKINNDIPVIIMTGFSSIDTAVKVIKSGAFDYIAKPFNRDELDLRIRRALENNLIILENKQLKDQLEDKYKFHNIIGKSKEMQGIYNIVKKVSLTNSTVLIRGESGTGKELIAQAIHYNSTRKNEPYVYLDCSSMVESLLESELFGHEKGSFTGALKTKEGLFVEAHNGTLFLDEIGNISMTIQAKLLRVLQEREIRPVGSNNTIKIDIRLITATNRNLEAMIAEGTFRNDLYYRFNVVPIFLPPLRERGGDIPILINHFLQKFSEKMNKDIKKISSEALLLLENYSWPGNVRELENVMERIIVMADNEKIDVDQLPLSIQKIRNDLENPESHTIPKTNEELKILKKEIREKAVLKIEKAFVLEALKRNDWNISRAAEEVRMKRENFHAIMKRNGISTNKSFHYNE